jgi:hypothetical protein
LQILLPRTLSIKNIQETIAVCSQIRANTGVILDASQLAYVSPLGMAMLKAAIHSNHECRCDDIVWMSVSKTSYLERMDFFGGVQCPGVDLPNNRRKDQSARLFEITLLSNDREAEDIAPKVASTMSKSIEAEAKNAFMEIGEDFDIEKIFEPLRYLISELLLNATTHSKRHGNHRSKAWVVAQKSTESNLEIAIVDDGCGILRTLEHVLNGEDRTHEGAIQKAMQPLVSCNLGIDEFGEETSNQGVGLFVAKDMLQSAGGSMQIITGSAIYDSNLSHLPKRSQQFTQSNYSWDGVAVAITVPCVKIYGAKVANSLAKIGHRDTSVELMFD